MRSAELERLGPHLEALYARAQEQAARIPFDPVQFPRAFRASPLDAELVGLLAALLAYGDARLFCPKVAQLVGAMGARPARFALRFSPARDGAPFENFRYRFNSGADIAALVAASGRVQRAQGSLGAAFCADYRAEGTIPDALERFVGRLAGAIPADLEAHFAGGFKGLGHLLVRPAGKSACKRWMLYLRWMVRGGPSEAVDLGLWEGIPKSALIVPLDTHLLKLARRLGLTARADASMRTALEITQALRRFDPEDPVKYDFALCHLGMSGRCPTALTGEACARCSLNGACPTGKARGGNLS